MKIKPIPTKYRDTMFRSTLEADWAATLDWYKIEWQYEPEGLQLPSGELYRPDFWLPRIRTYLEIKGLHGERVHKPEELRWAVCCEGECDHDGPVGRGFVAWRMVVIGGPADRDNRLRAQVPWVSTAFAQCRACRSWQWATSFTDDALACRVCGERDVDRWASQNAPSYTSGMLRERASLASPR